MTSPRKLIVCAGLALVIGLAFALLAKPPQQRTDAAEGIGNICRFDGPSVMSQGQTALFVFRIADNQDDIFDELGFEDTFAVTIDNISGVSKITAASVESGREFRAFQGFQLDEFNEVNPTTHITAIDSENPSHTDPRLSELLLKKYGYLIEGNPCGPDATTVYQACIRDGFCSEFRKANGEQRAAWANAMDEAMKKGVISCLDLAEIGEEALLDAGAPLSYAIGVPIGQGSDRYTGGINAYWLAVCDFTVPSLRVGPILDDLAFFTVTCEEPGRFFVTVSDKDDGDRVVKDPDGNDFLLKDRRDAWSREVVCKGEPSDQSQFLAFPNVLEIYPAPGSVSHSLVLVTLLDKHGETPLSGFDVEFMVDRCSIEASGVDTAQELFEAVNIFSALNPASAESVRAVEESAAAKAPVDSDRKQDMSKSYDIGDPVVSRAGAIVGCGIDDAPDVTPGIATITVIIALDDRPDVVLKVQIAVVGPPKDLAMEAKPATVVCGEKIAFTVAIKDAAGQAVSDNTRVEVVTNAGGVIGGTGAVAANEGAVTPLSSTVTSTYSVTQVQNGQEVRFGGIASFYLLTSELHTGTYEVVVTTGGTSPNGKSFVTPVQSLTLAVGCVPIDQLPTAQQGSGAGQAVSGSGGAPPAQSQAQPGQQTASQQASLAAPRPQFIPPNTGEAGLAASD